MFFINGKFTTATIMIDNVEESCIGQLTSIVNHPAFNNKIAIMPDVHSGKGSVIGFTMPISEKVVPQTIGVDIGCGVCSFNIGKHLPMSFEEIDVKIRDVVPMGCSINNNSKLKKFNFKKYNKTLHDFLIAFSNTFNVRLENVLGFDEDWFEQKCSSIGTSESKVMRAIGTLGGGNHFIELGIDSNNDYWLTIHTGSRNFGKRICDYWTNIAKQSAQSSKINNKKELIDKARLQFSGEQLFEEINKIKMQNKASVVPEYLTGWNLYGYLYDMMFAQLYAEDNRKQIIESIVKVLNVKIYDEIHSVHNYIDFRDFIIRKGSIRSYVGERMLIPFNMKDGILLCEGKTNPDWNFSAPHGAGRVLSRSKAKATINLDEFKEQMSGIYSTSVCQETLDEAPDAYKDASVIEKAIEPTAKIIDKIKPVLNIKSTKQED